MRWIHLYPHPVLSLMPSMMGFGHTGSPSLPPAGDPTPHDLLLILTPAQSWILAQSPRTALIDLPPLFVIFNSLCCFVHSPQTLPSIPPASLFHHPLYHTVFAGGKHSTRRRDGGPRGSRTARTTLDSDLTRSLRQLLIFSVPPGGDISRGFCLVLSGTYDS
jgi:hypothetical protein